MTTTRGRTFERLVDDEGERDDVGGEVETVGQGRRRVDVRHGQAPANQNNVGMATGRSRDHAHLPLHHVTTSSSAWQRAPA